MIVAAQNGHCEVVRMLLAANSNVNMRTNVSDMMNVCTVEGRNHCGYDIVFIVIEFITDYMFCYRKAQLLYTKLVTVDMMRL